MKLDSELGSGIQDYVLNHGTFSTADAPASMKPGIYDLNGMRPKIFINSLVNNDYTLSFDAENDSSSNYLSLFSRICSRYLACKVGLRSSYQFNRFAKVSYFLCIYSKYANGIIHVIAGRYECLV